MWCIKDLTPTYVERMEDVLEVYARPLNPREPVVCLDEKPVQIHREVQDPMRPEKGGEILKRDYEYRRAGMANVFCGVEPKTGIYLTKATPNRRAPAFARMIKEVAEAYPAADKIHLVLDNLNTHREKTLKAVFGPEEGHQIWSRFCVHYTPVHGSWLNQAEIAISTFSRQCLGRRRMSSLAELRSETKRWNRAKAKSRTPIHWTFTVAKARRKLHYSDHLFRMSED